jgi:NAD(P)-dependent dehydrogenase (short-subunit alcohol dehydrogenase family)
MSEFKDKVVIITGANGNLGSALARILASRGAILVLVSHEKALLHNLKQEIGNQAFDFECNLINSEAVNHCYQQIISQFGKVDILANIAGGFTMGPLLHNTSDKDWDFMMDLNARTVFNSCRSILPHFLENKSGKIVNVSARAAKEGKAKMAPYCASKAAVITLTEALAAEYRFDNINVNCILPGTIDTPQNRADMPNADFSKWVQPTELAEVIIFLTSTLAKAVNGAAVPVFGKS